ncbi:MAG: PadR family transcriptional regulator [Bacillaceae bacterium]|nr:PadR family transcriptional regulator [Bacillaceae bacterium]
MKQQTMPEEIYYILLALCMPLDGHEVMEKVSELSHGNVQMGAGTTYGILKRLHEVDHYIYITELDSNRKVYEITYKGKEALEQELNRLSANLKLSKERLTKGNLDE